MEKQINMASGNSQFPPVLLKNAILESVMAKLYYYVWVYD